MLVKEWTRVVWCAPMIERVKYDQVNKALGGRLPSQLRARRGRNDSFADIVFWIGRDTGMQVSVESVRQWCSRVLADAYE